MTHSERFLEWGPKISVTLSVVALVIVVLIAWRVWRDDTWAPLGPYPEQTVDAPTFPTEEMTGNGAVVLVPSVPIDQPIIVNGTKCADEDVVVEGVVTWRSVSPPGFSVETGRGIDDRPAGCGESTFENPIPDPVVDWAEAQFTAGRDHVLVQIGGCETPVRDSGEGETLCWHTETFGLLP